MKLSYDKKTSLVILLIAIVGLPSFYLVGLYVGRASYPSGATPVFEHPIGPNSYLFWKDGSTYYAKNGSTGEVTDNTNVATLVQQSNNALNSSGGGDLFFVADTYEFSSLFFVSDHVHLWGQGWNSTILKSADNLDTALIASDTAMSTQRDEDIGFHYLGFDGNAANQGSAQNLLVISGLSYGIVEHCKFYNIGKHAVLWAGGVDAEARPKDSKFLNNIIDANNPEKDGTDLLGFGFWDYGVIANNYISGDRTHYIAYNTLVSRAGMYMSIHHNTFENLPNNGISFESTWFTRVDGNTVNNVGYAGFSIGNNSAGFLINGYPTHNTFSNNIVNDTMLYSGIGMSSNYSRITNNQVSYCGLDGIFVAGDFNEISHNHVWNNDQNGSTRAGIWAQGYWNKIDYNYVWDDQSPPTQDYGIRTPSGFTNYTRITHNYLNGSVTQIVLSGATNSHVVKFNTGYVTENSGNATGTTPITVTHGLEASPLYPWGIVLVTAYADAGDVWVSNVNANTFRINWDGGGTVVFYWYAEYYPKP